MDSTEDTLPEEGSDEGRRSIGHAWLIYVGSAEDHFANAAAVWPLAGMRTVRFGRGTGDRVSAEIRDTTMHLQVPLGWVSHAHAELRIETDAERVEFELCDLGSRNGTHIDGQAVSRSARLLAGQIFEVGRSFWMVRMVADGEFVAASSRAFESMRTASPTLCAIHRSLEQVADSRVPVVLCGETGAGKEVIARAVHRASGRGGAFVSVNLAAIAEERLDCALLGVPAGSHATPDRPGLLEQAEGGTLYLDELAELSPVAQVKLLAALSQESIRKVGASGPTPADVRLISSSLKNVCAMAHAGRFRPDLYSRLAGFEACIPPLRDRREDLGALTRALCHARGDAQVRVASRAFRRILRYSWAFNVRELGQTLATASILAGTGGEITLDVLEEILERRRDMPSSPETVSALRAQLVNQLASSGGNTEAVALAFARETKEIHRWLERFDLQPDAYRPE